VAVGSAADRHRPMPYSLQQQSTADEIAKLDLLRRENVITEEEFQEGKRQLLSKR
jgi:hypothetical protein